jgi:hypothetical protein
MVTTTFAAGLSFSFATLPWTVLRLPTRHQLQTTKPFTDPTVINVQLEDCYLCVYKFKQNISYFRLFHGRPNPFIKHVENIADLLAIF